jgi:methylmalonyl-CoA mutase
LTEALAERSWTEFQRIEREGGIVESLRAGALQERFARMKAAPEKLSPQQSETAETLE